MQMEDYFTLGRGNEGSNISRGRGQLGMKGNIFTNLCKGPLFALEGQEGVTLEQRETPSESCISLTEFSAPMKFF